MILVNTDYISGKELEMLGLVKGSTIQSKNIGRDITQSFKTLVGGELGAYTDMMNQARETGHSAYGGRGRGSGRRCRGERALFQCLRNAGGRGSDGLRHCCSIQGINISP